MFRRLWLAQVVSNLGTWMQTVAAQWVILSATGSAALVGLVQTASTLPVVLLAAPAGVLADVLDRRRVLVAVQLCMVVAAGALAAVTFAGSDDPALLLGFTFLLGCGAAFILPAWQAIQPELVPRALLPEAAALGAVNMNLARAIGPALGGAIVAAGGAGWVFALNAASFGVVASAVAAWRRQVDPDPVGRERMVAALRSGARYVRHAPSMRRILLHSLLFVPAAAALWALLPVVARTLGLGAGGYGVLLGALGAGAVLGAVLLPRVRARVPLDLVLAGAVCLYAAALAAIAYAPGARSAVAALACAGVAWIAVLSTLNATAQVVLPAWVRARALSYFLVVFMGGQAVGGVVWGVAAGNLGLRRALLLAAGLLLAGTAVAWRFPLAGAARLDPAPSRHWADPPAGVDLDAGPVLVVIDYAVRPGCERSFAAAMDVVSRSRRRTGADEWMLHRDLADPSRFVETFAVPTWGEHVRQHGGRLTVFDRRAEEEAHSFLTAAPAVRHLLAAGSADHDFRSRMTRAGAGTRRRMDRRTHADEGETVVETSRPPRPSETGDKAAADTVVELPDSRAEPGGPPVRVDPAMVDETTAERMRPSEDPRHR